MLLQRQGAKLARGHVWQSLLFEQAQAYYVRIWLDRWIDDARAQGCTCCWVTGTVLWNQMDVIHTHVVVYADAR